MENPKRTQDKCKTQWKSNICLSEYTTFEKITENSPKLVSKTVIIMSFRS